MSSIRVAAIIPARMASSRFPGKPLLMVHDLPMIEHVRRRALLCGRFSQVVVATCDEEIAAVVRRQGGECVMTSPKHPAATDRVAEAMSHLDCTHVVNVQGDELLILPSDLDRFVEAMEREPEAPAWNAVSQLEHPDELRDRSIVKCALSISGRILFCARDFSWLPVEEDFEPLRRILGILGYRRDFLESFACLTRAPLETAESVDQSRIIEHDILLRSVEFSKGYPGINEPREVEIVQAYLEQDSQQKKILQELVR